MSAPRFDISELKDLARQIKALYPDSPEWTRKLVKINREAGRAIIDEAEGIASGIGRPQRRAAEAIKPKNTARDIGLTIGSGGFGGAVAALWGTKRRTGWYGAKRYKNSPGRQFLPWVGNSWEVGGPGGPYALNPAVRAKLPDVLEDWTKAIEELIEEIKIDRS